MEKEEEKAKEKEKQVENEVNTNQAKKDRQEETCWPAMICASICALFYAAYCCAALICVVMFACMGIMHVLNMIVTPTDVGPVNLAFVCAGNNATRSLYTSMKSILLHRTDSELELHLFVDHAAQETLEDLFDTWSVPNLKINYYSLSNLPVPQDHFNKYFPLMAPLHLADRGVGHALFLQTDMMVLGDIALLYNELKKSECKWYSFTCSLSMIHLARSQTRELWAADTFQAPRRLIDHRQSFNTAVMLVNLARLKRVKEAWIQLLAQDMFSRQANQEIVVNGMGWEYFEKLDCKFNLQLNDRTNLDESCPGHEKASSSSSSLRLVTFGKLESKRGCADYYLQWRKVFESLSGQALRKRVGRVDGAPSGSPIESCRDIQPGPHERPRTFIKFLDVQASRRDDDLDVTLAVDLSLDRLGALNELAANWPGPISAAIYLRETDIGSVVVMIQEASALARRRNIGYHLMFNDYGQSYPVNKLRNLALKQTSTPYVFLGDLDLVPEPELYRYLREYIRELITPINKNTTALVVPVFEVRDYNNNFTFPEDKAELLRRLDAGSVSKWPAQSQAATQYDKWRQANTTYEVQWERDYEPFIVAHKDVARYDERFVGAGWSRLEHVALLAANKYKFHVLPEGVAIRTSPSGGGGTSSDLSLVRRPSRKQQMCVENLKSLFDSELRENYPRFYKTRVSASASS